MRALVVKSQSIFAEDMNFETRQRCGTWPPSKQNKTRFTCQPPTMRSTCRHWSPEPYQPHSIPPNWGAHAVTGAQNSVPSPLSTPKKALIPKLKYEALEISEVRGPFERKVHSSYFGPLGKEGIFTIHLLLAAPFESKVAHS